MDKQKLFMLKEDAKTHINIAINHIINDKLNETSEFENEYKQMLYILEEARINIENNRFFDLDDCTRIIANLYFERKTDDTFFFVSQAIQKSDLYHKTIVEEFVKTQFTKVVYRFERNVFILKICHQPELFKEFVNYILNNNNFVEDEEPIVVRGITAREMLALDGDILSVYRKMMQYQKVWC